MKGRYKKCPLIGIRSLLIMVGRDASRKPPSQHLQEGGRGTRRLRNVHHEERWGGGSVGETLNLSRRASAPRWGWGRAMT